MYKNEFVLWRGSSSIIPDSGNKNIYAPILTEVIFLLNLNFNPNLNEEE